MSTICNYINPCSSEFHAAVEDFKNLSCKQRTGILLITTLVACTIIFAIAAIPLFRCLVERYTVRPLSTPTIDNALNAAAQNLPVLNNQEILNLFKKHILNTVEELKPIDELQSFENLTIYHPMYAFVPNQTLLSGETLRDWLGKAISVVFEHSRLDDPIRSLKWSLIAKDTKGILHGVVSEAILSLQDNVTAVSGKKNFYKDIDPINQHELHEIIIRKSCG